MAKSVSVVIAGRVSAWGRGARGDTMAEVRMGILLGAASILCAILLDLAISQVPTVYLLLGLVLVAWFGGVWYLVGRD